MHPMQSFVEKFVTFTNLEKIDEIYEFLNDSYIINKLTMKVWFLCNRS